MAQSSPTSNFRRLILISVGILLIIVLLLKNVTISVTLENRTFTTTPRSSILSSNYSFSSLKTGQIYKPGFEYPNTKLCRNKGTNVKLIILITSPPYGHEDRRQNIRNTWGHFALRKDIVIGFVIGQPKDIHFKNENQIKKEMEIYNDIILENNIDSYENLTLKTLSMLEWASNYCNQSKYLLKTDDDMWINVPNILNFIDGLDNKNSRKIYGSLRKNEKPIRTLNSKYAKYFVPFEQYDGQFFPTFTPGPAYLLPQQIWKDLYDEALTSEFVKLEDVFITGIIAEKLNIERVGANKFLMGGGFDLAKMLKYSAVSLSSSRDLYRIWGELNVNSTSVCSAVGWPFYCIVLFIIGLVNVGIFIWWRSRRKLISRENKV